MRLGQHGLVIAHEWLHLPKANGAKATDTHDNDKQSYPTENSGQNPPHFDGLARPRLVVRDDRLARRDRFCREFDVPVDVEDVHERRLGNSNSKEGRGCGARGKRVLERLHDLARAQLVLGADGNVKARVGRRGLSDLYADGMRGDRGDRHELMDELR